MLRTIFRENKHNLTTHQMPDLYLCHVYLMI